MTQQHAKVNMIKQQLRTGDVLNESILDLFETIPRDDFVPASMQQFAYADMQIPLAHDQQMLTPLEEGQILQALALQGHETVLEVGTGTGYLTVLLSKLAKQVISIDYFPKFTEEAEKKLSAYQCDNVTLVTGDACRGWVEKAPYDVLILSGAVEKITLSHKLQILPGGKLFAIVGEQPCLQGQLLTLDYKGNWQEILLFTTQTPFLIDPSKPKVFRF